VLAFASHLAASKPFGAQDNAYVEVLASFFATHYQQRWQSSRIGHQLEHDSLTGVWNRSRFRSLGRAAFRAGEPAAIAVVDMVAFQALNEAHGHLNGDAVLVEVAAALASKAYDDELVARISGDTFAIFFPRAPSHEWLIESIRRFGSVFADGMGIGDRDGKEFLNVAARIGFAHAPRDGTTLDALLLRAEGRARVGAPAAEQFTFP